MEEINKNINIEKLKLHGKSMIKVGLEEIEDSGKLGLSFKTCFTKIWIGEEHSSSLDVINTEMLKKYSMLE